MLIAPFLIFLITITLVVLLIIFNPTFYSLKNLYIYPPVFAVVILLAFQYITPRDVLDGGILGSDGIRPYSIVILIFSMACICSSLDVTGALTFISTKVVKYFGKSKMHLFTGFYLFCMLATIGTSNDVVILTMTPVILSACRMLSIPPLPFLFAQFYAANLGSLVFIIGNPTNVIIGEAFEMTFIRFTRYSAIPAFVCAAMGYICLYLIYRKDLTTTPLTPTPSLTHLAADVDDLTVHDTETRSENSAHLDINSNMRTSSNYEDSDVETGVTGVHTGTDSINVVSNDQVNTTTSSSNESHTVTDSDNGLLDARGAIVHSVCVCVCLLVMVISSFVEGLQLWMIALSAASLSLLYSIWTYPIYNCEKCVDRAVAEGVIEDLSHNTSSNSTYHVNSASDDNADDNVDENVDSSVRIDGDMTVSASSTEVISDDSSHSKHSHTRSLHPSLSVYRIISSLPWELVPFLFGMFTLAHTLLVTGWIDKFSTYYYNLISGDSASIWSASFPTAFIAVLLCNLVNNQPATILLTRILSSTQIRSLPPLPLLAAIFSTIAASNIAALLTPIGALAGILFTSTVRNGRCELTWWTFTKNGLIVAPIVTAATTLAVCISVQINGA